MESCDVIPSPIEVTDWYTNWRHAGGIFDGIHQVCGIIPLHTLLPAGRICDYYGGLIHGDFGVLAIVVRCY